MPNPVGSANARHGGSKEKLNVLPLRATLIVLTAALLPSVATAQTCTQDEIRSCVAAHNCAGTQTCTRNCEWDPEIRRNICWNEWGSCIENSTDTSSATPQYTVSTCTWTNRSIPVLFNAGTAAANGFFPERFRDELINAMAMWNEESQSGLDFLYAGDTTQSQVTGNVVVRHQDTWACVDNTSAKAFWPGSGNCAAGAPEIVMIMQDSCNPGTQRQWRTGWPGSTFQAWGLGGAMGYEHVAGHELGHMLGFPDAGPYPAVMCCNNRHTSFRMLYPIDINTARRWYGTPARFVATATTTDGLSLSGVSMPICKRTTLPPSLTSFPSSTQPLRMSLSESSTRFAQMQQGTHATWTTHPSEGDAADAHKWTSVSSSTYGETLVVWPINCDNNVGCDIRWAWTNNNGSSWTRGTLTDADTYGRPAVAYDVYADRFVLAFIDVAESRVITRSAPAISAPAWSANNPTGALPYRYMGGMVFDSAGNGLLLAASDDAAAKNRIAQFQLVRSGSTYNTGVSSWALANAGAANTRRHFDVSRNPVTGLILLAWRDGGNPRPLATATKTSMSAADPFMGPNFPLSSISNGVDLAFDEMNSRFVVGFTYK